MGLLSGLISTATNAVGANENAQANAAKSNMAATLQRAQLQRQDQQDLLQQAIQAREAHSQELRDQLTGVQIKDTNAQAEQRTYAAAHPKPVKPNLSQPIIGPDGKVQVINYDDITHPVVVPGIQGKVEHEPQGPRDQIQLVQTPGPDGKPVYYRVNLTTGEKTPLDLSAVQKGGSGGVMQTMVQQHYHSARNADQRLNQFGGTVASHGQISNFLMGHNPFDSDLQQANQAGEEFATLIAPLVNRGRTTHIELDQIKKSYVPLASDSKATIAQKAASRKALLDAFAQEAGDTGTEDVSGGTPAAHPLKSKYGLE